MAWYNPLSWGRKAKIIGEASVAGLALAASAWAGAMLADDSKEVGELSSQKETLTASLEQANAAKNKLQAEKDALEGKVKELEEGTRPFVLPEPEPTDYEKARERVVAAYDAKRKEPLFIFEDKNDEVFMRNLLKLHRPSRGDFIALMTLLDEFPVKVGGTTYKGDGVISRAAVEHYMRNPAPEQAAEVRQYLDSISAPDIEKFRR